MKKNIIWTVIVFAIITLIFGVSIYGCAKEEPVKVKVGKSTVAEKAPAPAPEAAPAVPSAPATPKVVPPTVTLTVPIFDNVYFAFNHYGPKKESTEAINALVDWMKKNTTAKVLVSGHTDTQGDYVYNEELSEKRATYVAKILVKNGISEDRIKTEWHGEDKPVSKKHSENRRVEFTIFK